MKKTLTLTYRKSTKGTHVYENTDYNVSFYLPKLMLDDPAKAAPQTLKLTIETD
jgi:hypothetical protein